MRRWFSLILMSQLVLALPVQAAKLETATFAAGCFWGTEEFFRKVPGVVETRVGYTGGDKPASYEDVASSTTGHAESLELSFDPSKVAYKDLLILFFKMHDPTTPDQQGNDRGSQYRSAIFTHGDAQAKTAAAVKTKVERSGAWGKPVVTQIVPAGPFYQAEDYHQKYLVKNPGGYDNHFLRNLQFDAKADSVPPAAPAGTAKGEQPAMMMKKDQPAMMMMKKDQPAMMMMMKKGEPATGASK